ncbi:non-ribosomal peptide synthetase [Streptomyces sp. NPDC057654]|uniref:non-ribosomal peptide synthetase n=1 Tax=Streptomyces sp. NPDC057654 TaxID=3346196 RepID=UPI0036A0F808
MTPLHKSPTVPELFESAVEKWPDESAVIHGDTTLSYMELNEKVNRLARHLIGHGVGPDVLVAVAVPRSTDLVVVLLAVFKAGGAYLPLDPAYPEARLSYMVKDARPLVLVRTARTRVPDVDVTEIVLDEPATRDACAAQSGHDVTQDERTCALLCAHLMYVIYTSGSTGQPKGVAVTHQGVGDLFATQSSRFGVRPGERVLQWASVSFDAAFWDLTLALLSGATLVMADPEDVLPGQPLTDLLTRHRITHAVLPPAVLSLTDSTAVLKGGTLMSTGDACTTALIHEWSLGRRMFNGYGPTEVTVGATISGPETGTDDVSIGVPWTGGRAYVLGDDLRPAPDGQEGELYLAGSGLARGYLSRPGLTAATFLPDPFGPPGSRMYRSGDRGWRRADGVFFFSGRADDQVKVRGFRIELGEIEARLAQHPAVDLAAVVVKGELADALVVGYVQAAPGMAVTATELRGHVADVLPEHMVPATIVVLEKFPLSSGGKVDRRALRALASHAEAETAPMVRSPETAAGAPHGGAPTEAALCALVMELLSLPSVTPDQNLFDLGGNSLVAAKLAIRIREDLGVGVSMRSVLRSRTLSELASSLLNEDDGVPDLSGAPSAYSPVPIGEEAG